jgi:putative NADH-flavin reductase
MKVLIFGASGKTGHHLIRVALSRRHKVSAFVRDPSRLLIDYSRLRIYEGDVRDYEAVENAVRGQDVVVCALGVRVKSPSNVLSEGTWNIVRAMKSHGVRRLVCLSSAGVLGDDAGFFLRRIRIPLLYKYIFEDKKRQLEIVQNSGLDWIVIRPPALTDNPLIGKYEISKDRPKHRTITRIDLAIFMINQLKNKEFVHKMPAVSN